MIRLVTICALALAWPAAAAAQSYSPPDPPPYQPPMHVDAPSPLIIGSEIDVLLRADAGTQIERHRSPRDELDEHRKLDRALKALAPERKGVVDAYVVSIALDSDPVFGREAREAARVLARRYDAATRTITLAGSDGSAPSALPRGTPQTLAVVLARVAEVMNRREDVLILYTTSHGAPFGLYYHDADNGFGAVSPVRMAKLLDELGLGNRLLILSACYSGIFVPLLGTESSAVVTAAAPDRTSFGCAADNDWTFFGDALVNHALRKPQPLDAAYGEAHALITQWEARGGIIASLPQLSIGPSAARWLAALDQRTPRVATPPVGRPALETSLAP